MRKRGGQLFDRRWLPRNLWPRAVGGIFHALLQQTGRAECLTVAGEQFTIAG